MPLFRPASSTRNGGSPDVLRIGQLRETPLADRAQLSDGDLERSPSPARPVRRGSCRRRRPVRRLWRPRVGSTSAPSGKTSGLSVAELISISRTRRTYAQRVGDRAVDLGHAADRVRVLDLVRLAVMGLHQLRVAQQRAQLRGDAAPDQDAAASAWYAAAKATSVPSSASTDIEAITVAVLRACSALSSAARQRRSSVACR